MAIVDMFKKDIVKFLKSKGYKLPVGSIERPKQAEHGDFAVPCFIFAKEHKKSPFEIALELKNTFEPTKLLEKAEHAGPYLNFFINKNILAEKLLKEIEHNKETFGAGSAKQKIMVEFCSPNTNKPLHLGHIRNMMLGEAVSTLLDFAGNKVVKSCLVNDRGAHICKSMLAYDLWGENTDPKTAKKKGDHLVGDFYVMYNKYEDDDMKKLVQQMLQKWEANDQKTRSLWKKMNTWVLSGFEETYAKLGVKFDKYYYESEIYDKGKDIIMQGLEAGTFMKEDGAVVAPLEKHKLPNKVLIRSDGTTIYMTQDIYLAIRKIKDYDLDSSIYVVGNEQNLHFQQLFKILKLLGYEQAEKCFHLSYGMVNLPEGKMKSREGTVVDADDLIEELIDLAKDEIKKRDDSVKKKELETRAYKIAMAGLKFLMLKLDPVKEMTFNPKESLSFEGETGPYVQYTAVRIGSILQKSKQKVTDTVDYNRMEQPELDLVSVLAQYEDVVADAAEKMKPNLIANYLIDLSQAFNSYYHSTKIVNTGMEKERLFLISAVRDVLVSGLKLLGIEVPEKM
jgi:arginyl-tRNA synthetase